MFTTEFQEDIAPASPTQDFRQLVCRRISHFSAQDRQRLRTAIVAVGGHPGSHSAFIYYHRVRRLRRTPTGWTFVSELERIHRIPLDGSEFPLIIWSPATFFINPYPSPPPSRSPSPIPVVNYRPRGNPRNW